MVTWLRPLITRIGASVNIVCSSLINMAIALTAEISKMQVRCSQDDSFEEEDTKEPEFTSEDFSRVDDTLHDPELEHSSSTTPLTSISFLMSLLAPLPRSA